MRVVFLDFDGVICTSDTYTAGSNRRPETLISPELVRHVDELCRRAGAVVVISSAWRTLYPLDKLRAWLAMKGLSAPVVGATPSFERHRGRMMIPGHRGSEIVSYMNAHGLRPEDVVVLEDAEDVRPLQDRQVLTMFKGPEAGFTRRHLRRALELWAIGSSPRLDP